MANNNDFRRGIRIYLETSEYLKGIKELEASTAQLDKEYARLVSELERLKNAGVKSGTEFKTMEKTARKLQQQINKNSNTMARYHDGLEKTKAVLKNLSGAPLKDLIAVKRVLANEIKSLDRNTDKYRATLKHYQSVSEQVSHTQRQMNTNMRASSRRMSKLADGFNKYFGIIGTAVASITGLSYSFRRLAENVAEMDDLYADVMKTTGLAREEVVKLNDAFAQLDTRTSREQLNRLAYEAGKLGITGRDDILAFVDAANQITVALGEDLGDDATKSIGKMVNVFEQSTQHLQRLGLREQMLSVGSAINELGASSSASESYLVEFAGRLGGVAAQAGIGIDKILGLGSALDQNMQQVEMSATAVQQFLTQLLAQPVKFAQIAGVEIEQFNKLLREDTNAALIMVLKALKERGGFSELVPLFDEIGINGQRLIGVLSSLATNIEQVQTAQRVANDALVAGTSLTNEYAIKNNTLAARLDKAKKQFSDTALQLGEKLNPLLLKSTNLTTAMIRVLVRYPGIVKTLLFLLGAVASAYALKSAAMLRDTVITQANVVKSKALIAVEQLQIMWNNRHVLSLKALSLAKNLLTLRLGKARLAFSALTKTMNANAFVAITTLVIALGTALWNLTQRLFGATEAQKAMRKEIASESVELNKLFASYRNANDGTERKSKLLDEIKSKYGDYIGHLIDEKGRITDIGEAQRIANEQLQRNIALKARETDQTDIDTTYVERVSGRLDGERERLTRQTDQTTVKEVLGEVKTYFDQMNKSTTLSTAHEDMQQLYRDYNLRIDGNMRVMVAALYHATEKRQRDTERNNDRYAPFIADAITPFTIAQPTKDKPTATAPARPTTPTTPSATSSKSADPYAEQSAQLEIAYKREAYQIRKNGDGDPTQYAALLQAEEKYLTDKIALQHKYGKQTIDTEVSLFAVRERQEKDQSETLLNAFKLTYETKQQTTQAYYDTERTRLTEQYHNNLLTKEQYDEQTNALDLVVAERKRANAKAYLEQLQDSEMASQSVKKKAIQQTQQVVAQAEQSITDLQARANEQRYQNIKQHLQRVAQLRKELGLDAEKLNYQEGLEALKEQLKEANATQEEQAQAIYRYKVKTFQAYAQETKKIASALSNAIHQYQQMQTASLEAEKQQELAIASDNAEKRKVINEKYAQKELDLKKKQANADMAINIATALSDGALAIANILSVHASNPILSGILIATTAATMALQIGTIIAQRNAIAATTLNSSGAVGTDSNTTPQGKLIPTAQAQSGRWNVIGKEDEKPYRNVPYEGMAQTGIVATPTLVGERGDELIIDHPTLHNIRMNAPHILQEIMQQRVVPQRANGQYAPITTPTELSTNATDEKNLTQALKELTQQITWLQSHRIEARVVLSELDKKRNLYEQSIKNGSK